MPTSKEIQERTLQQYIDSWSQWDAALQLKVFADNFTQVTLPLSMDIPARSRAEVEQVLPALVATVSDYKLTIHHVVHDAANNMAVVFATSKGSVPWGPWNLEYAIFITFSEAGDKIAKLEEYLDTAFLQDFGPKFGRYLQEHGGPAGVVAAKSRS